MKNTVWSTLCFRKGESDMLGKHHLLPGLLMITLAMMGTQSFADYRFQPKGYQEVEKANAPKKPEVKPEETPAPEPASQALPDKEPDKVNMGETKPPEDKTKSTTPEEKTPTADEKYKAEQPAAEKASTLPAVTYSRPIQMKYGFCRPGYIDLSAVPRQTLRSGTGVAGLIKSAQTQSIGEAGSTVIRVQNYSYKGLSANRTTFSRAENGKTQYVVSDVLLNKPYLYVARYETPHASAVNTTDPNACLHNLAAQVLAP
jgi:hypothetical protein